MQNQETAFRLKTADGRSVLLKLSNIANIEFSTIYNSPGLRIETETRRFFNIGFDDNASREDFYEKICSKLDITDQQVLGWEIQSNANNKPNMR